MAFTQTRNVGGQTSEISVCSDLHPDDCVGVGIVHHDVTRALWTIVPARAPVTDEVYATDEAAIIALVEHEYAYVTQVPTEAVDQPSAAVQKTIAFLRELLTEDDGE